MKKSVIQLNSTTLDLKKKYSSELVTLRAIFEHWSDMDFIACLEEAQGDLQLAIGRISEGQAEQWGEVKTNKKKEKPTKKVEVPAPVRGTRGGRGGRGGRGRGGRGGYTGDRGSKPHGGEKSASLDNNDGWDAPVAESGTIANTDDWGTTAIQATNDEWAELEKNTSKLSIKEKKEFKVVLNKSKAQPVGNAPPAAAGVAPKKSNWADIVKKKEPEPEPVKEQPKSKPVSPVKEVVEVVNSPPKQTLPTRSPSPQHVQASPKPKTPVSPPKNQFTSPRIDSEPVQQSPVQASESQMPPGLVQGKGRKVQQESPVVMPASAILSGTGVQFGSFKAEAESPDRVEEQPQQFKIQQPKQNEPVHPGAPGLGGQYYAPNNLNGMPDYNGMYDDRGMGGYYVPDGTSYASSKFGTDSNATAAQSPAPQHAEGSHHPQNFQPYPYYPYYMPNQFQQSHFQPMYGQPFGKGYGFQQPAVPSPSQAAGAHTSSQSKPSVPASGLTAGLSNQAPSGYPYLPGQQFYPSNVPYEDVPEYGKYGQQNFAAFNSTIQSKPTRNSGRTYEQKQSGPTPQQPIPNYYGNQMHGMHYQPFMMQPGYPQQQMHQGYQRNQQQQGYWNGN